jgi:hypothetical protein
MNRDVLSEEKYEVERPNMTIAHSSTGTHFFSDRSFESPACESPAFDSPELTATAPLIPGSLS